LENSISESRSSKQERRHFSGLQKTSTVNSHLIDGMSVADLCDQHGGELVPTSVSEPKFQNIEPQELEAADDPWIADEILERVSG